MGIALVIDDGGKQTVVGKPYALDRRMDPARNGTLIKCIFRYCDWNCYRSLFWIERKHTEGPGTSIASRVLVGGRAGRIHLEPCEPAFAAAQYDQRSGAGRS